MEENLYQEEIINPGDQASKLGRDICFNSHKNCPAVIVVPHEPDNFRGPVGFAWRPHILREMAKTKIEITNVRPKWRQKFGILPKNSRDQWQEKVTSWSMMEEEENDGAGGKPQFFTAVGTPEVFHKLGCEIIAMTADDFARSGRLPCIIKNEMQMKYVNEYNFHLVRAALEGYGKALAKSNLMNITGETAIMKRSITAFCDDVNRQDQLMMTWGASCTGLASSKLLLRPNNIGPDMLIVALLEPSGYRCNGGGFFADLMLNEYGTDIRKMLNNPEAMKFAKQLTAPSTSYAKTICRLIGWEEDGHVGRPLVDILGIAHITGGGIWGKFGEMLPAGVGAMLASMPSPSAVQLQAQKMSWKFPHLKLNDDKAYGQLNGGCGMLMVVRQERDVVMVLEEASKDNIQARYVGRTNSSGLLSIISKYKEGGILTHELVKH